MKHLIANLRDKGDWPATAGWAEIMAVAYASHVVIVGTVRGTYGFEANAFRAADTVDLVTAIAAAIGVSFAVRLGNKGTYIVGSAMLVLPLIDFVQNLPGIANAGAMVVSSAFLPALFALISLGYTRLGDGTSSASPSCPLKTQ